jgi:crotonobetainyl-CoA:carnitine CoA-transferase CaiB-like acyl-CoA transferase
MSELLAGVRVVDLSRILAGPFATQLLADLGATVEKFEPIGGDATRSWGPPFARNGESAYFQSANRGKTTREIDLRSAEGKQSVARALESADVVVENFLPEAARELGLDPSTLRERYPRLIVASIRAFASDTEARDRAGYDFLMQAEAGWMQITGEADGRPMKVGVALVDVLTGLYVANAVQAALLARTRSGRGTHVEVPLFEVAVAGLVNVASSALVTGETPRRFGNAHPSIVPYQTFACRDGEVAIAVGNDRQFSTLCLALGVEADARWATNPGRVMARSAVVAALESATRAMDTTEVLDRCRHAGVAAGPIRGVEAVVRDESGELHRAVRELRDAATGEAVKVIASPILVDGVRACSELPPPRRV